jgi:multiple sugar transport system permease protein
MTGATRAFSRPAVRVAPWKRRGTRRAATFYLLISPWLVGFVLLAAIPLVMAFVMSLTNYDGLNLDYVQFVGVDNFVRAFTDEDAQHALGRTLLLMAFVVPVGLGLQLALAIMVNQPIRFANAFRTIFYLPYVIPVVAAAWVWKIFVDPTGGLLNAMLGVVAGDVNVRWLVEYPTVVLALLTIWGAAGGGMVVFLAGLQGIPAEYREAAMIDGANRLQVTRHITLPLLSPVIFFNLVTGIIATLQILVQPMLLAPGILGLSPGTVPPRDNYLYAVHAYLEIFVKQLFGYGSALLWLLFAVVLVLTLVLFKTSRRWVFYGVEP